MSLVEPGNPEGPPMRGVEVDGRGGRQLISLYFRAPPTMPMQIAAAPAPAAAAAVRIESISRGRSVAYRTTVVVVFPKGTDCPAALYARVLFDWLRAEGLAGTPSLAGARLAANADALKLRTQWVTEGVTAALGSFNASEERYSELQSALRDGSADGDRLYGLSRARWAWRKRSKTTSGPKKRKK